MSKESDETLAYINPKIMKWLQNSLNFSDEEMAKIIGISSDDYEKVSNGESLLTFKQFRAFTKKLDLSMLLFYLDEPPEWGYSTFILKPDEDEGETFPKTPITFDIRYDLQSEEWHAYHKGTGLHASGKTFEELRNNILEKIDELIDDIFNKGTIKIDLSKT